MCAAREVELCSRVPADGEGVSLVDYLARRFRYRDRGAWLASIEDGSVQVDGASASPQLPLRAGQRVGYRHERQEPAVAGELRILHEAPSWVVVDKPPGLPCHADGAFVQTTLVHRLAERLGLDRVRLVHRLDRETGGVMVVATSRAASRALHAQFEARTVEKVYEVMVRGVVEADRLDVELPIARCPESAVSMRRRASLQFMAEDAQSASTRFEVLERGERSTRLRALPRTGRAHQIRVHLEAIGHPVLGDKLYGRSDAEFIDWIARVKESGPVAAVDDPTTVFHRLHARSLAFDDPSSGERRQFESPPAW